MPARNKKLRNILAGLIIFLGLISLVLVLSTSNSYQNLSIKHARNSLANFVDFRVNQLLASLEDQQAGIGSRLQREIAFRNAVINRDQDSIRNQVKQLIDQGSDSNKSLGVVALTVYDNNLSVLNRVKGSDSSIYTDQIAACPELLAQAGVRTDVDKTRIISHRCVINNRPVQTVLMPIGESPTLGYLQVSADPAYSLQTLERELAMPIQLHATNGDLLFASQNWPAQISSKQLLLKLSPVTSSHEPLLQVSVAQDIAPLVHSLESSRNRVLVFSSVVVILAVMVVLGIVGRALRPLAELKAAAARIARGQHTMVKAHSGYEEIATPINSFNKMADDLNRENQSLTRAQEALTQATMDAERLAQKAFEEKKFTQTTLNAIRDGVITSNTDDKVLFMNPAAAKLTGVNPTTAIGHSLAEVFSINEDIHQLDSESIRPWSNQELRLRRADGDEIEIEALSSVMYSPDGEVIGTVTVFSDVTKQRELTRRLSYAASHDALTGLVNRSEFERRLEETIRVAHMDNSEHTLCYMDLDQFKIVNDTCGHIAGDELLRQVTSLLRSQVSRRDTLGRLGGDEFGLLMENCGLDTAQEVATRLLESIRRYQFVWEDHTFTVGCSIGIVKFDGASENMAKLMSAADTACYIAKDRGRNRIEIVRAENVDLEKRQGEMQWILKMNAALQEGNFVLYRQLIVPGKGTGNNKARYEILIRLKGENGELILPDVFLPAAERFDLISKIDEWVVHATLEWLKQLSETDQVLVSINLSGASIANRKFLDFVVHQIHDFDIDPTLICFEVTETAAIANLSHAQQFMSIVTGLGCRFALDDFGSGLSSFAYLKSLPVQYLKIDGLFIRDIHRDPVDLAMVKSINEVGHALGLLTVAEFVDSKEVIEVLNEIEVDFLQGFEIARPEPLDNPL